MLRLKSLKLLTYRADLSTLSAMGKTLVTTINAHSYNVAQSDKEFADSLEKSDILLPDGVSIVISIKLLTGKRIQRIAGYDLFCYCMDDLNKRGGTCFFLGSSQQTLDYIVAAGKIKHPNVKIKTYTPPFKDKFSDTDSQKMIEAVNAVQPDILWIGMTAPKQEKWAFQHLNQLQVNGVIGCIGAVFDFYAGTVRRAPIPFMRFGLEWFYRFVSEPRRLWKRYLIGNILFVWNLLKE